MTQLWRSFGDRLPIIVVAAMGIAATVLVLRRLAMRGRRIAVIAVLSMWLTAVAALTLLPAAGMRGRSIDLLPLRSTANMLLHAVDWQVAASQVGGNLILFIPLGLFLPLLSASARRSVLHTAGVAAAIACGIEAAQWVLAIGRVTAIDDVMIATFGAVVGWVLSKLWRYLGIDPVGDVMPHYSANRGDAQVR